MPPFRLTQPVRFADIDHAGIVYFAKFFHFAHLALEEFFHEHVGGRAYAQLLDEKRVGFPAVETACRFVGPLRFGDIMDIELSITRMGRSSIHFRFAVYRQPERPAPDAAQQATPGDDPGQAEQRRLCAEGRYVTAVVDLDAFRPIPVPDFLREILHPLIDTGESAWNYPGDPTI